MFYSYVFPGITVDVTFYDDNPSEDPLLEGHFYNGYFEALITVTQDNLSVCPKERSILFVRPVLQKRGLIGSLGDYTYIAISQSATLKLITTGAKMVATTLGIVEADIVLFSFLTDTNDIEYSPIVLKHDKEAWLDTLSSRIFGDDAAL